MSHAASIDQIGKRPYAVGGGGRLTDKTLLPLTVTVVTGATVEAVVDDGRVLGVLGVVVDEVEGAGEVVDEDDAGLAVVAVVEDAASGRVVDAGSTELILLVLVSAVVGVVCLTVVLTTGSVTVGRSVVDTLSAIVGVVTLCEVVTL